VVVVAAGDARGALTPYSNWGKEVSLMAPGGDMKRDDDKDGRPDGILSTKRSTQCKDPITQQPLPNCFYAYEMGTSMAAPHVAAALALLKSQYPEKTNDELIALVVQKARSPRTQIACSGACDKYPGSTPIQGQTNVCFRPCGSGLLNLSLVGAK
jgi:serine protease